MNPRNARGGSAPDGSSGLRTAIEARSAAPLVLLSRTPRWVLLAVVFGLLVIGMAGSGWVGASGLLVLLVVLAWFAYLNWPSLDLPGRILRLAALVVLAVFAVGHLW
ncbi:DUF6703 family protein [Actinomadura rugatobispora]|uniref:DUF6703 family protein n=1 Tax=Actinomadura rugatobispora TaxID=1994 RepID=A0ABW1A4I0_9ACTN